MLFLYSSLIFFTGCYLHAVSMGFLFRFYSIENFWCGMTIRYKIYFNQIQNSIQNCDSLCTLSDVDHLIVNLMLLPLTYLVKACWSWIWSQWVLILVVELQNSAQNMTGRNGWRTNLYLKQDSDLSWSPKSKQKSQDPAMVLKFGGYNI